MSHVLESLGILPLYELFSLWKLTLQVGWVISATAHCFEAYIQIIKNYVKKDGKKLITFQQDGAPCHTAKATTAAMQKINICVLPWVAQSPDLNPIEHLWDHLGRVIDEMRPTSLVDLKDKLFSAWKSITPEVTEKLVD